MDGERGYHAFTNLTWPHWSFIANLSTRLKNVAVVPWTATLFADQGTKIEDERDFAEVRYKRDLDAVNRVQFHAYYDRYKGYGRYSRPLQYGPGILDERDTLLGDWAGSQIVFCRQTQR